MWLRAEENRIRQRAAAAAGVAALHLLLGWALISGFAFEFVRTGGERLKMFDIAEEQPPPPLEEPPQEAKAPGEASPENLKAKAAPVVAPPPKIRIETPPPVSAAIVPGQGSERDSGASDKAGPGTGAGGAGGGTGGGGSLAAPAERLSGALTNRDYPRAALRAGAEGTVRVLYTVGTDGRVRDCRVTGSSGHAELDAVTCRLVEARFRYRPARDAYGRPVPEIVGKTYSWYVPFKRRADPEKRP